MITGLPAGPLVGLTPETTGFNVTTSKSPAFKTPRPFEPKMSFMSHTRLMPLVEFTEADAPVTYIELPMSATIKPYCCMARAMVCDCGPMALMRLFTAVVFFSRNRVPNGTFAEPCDVETTCDAG